MKHPRRTSKRASNWLSRCIELVRRFDLRRLITIIAERDWLLMKYDIALVGCGAIAQLFYLPALARNRSKFGDIWLVDPNDRALALATATVSGNPAQSYSEVPNDVPLVVVATPNKFHIPLALEALARNANVLIEKPFATSPEEGRNLIETAEKGGRVVAVNQTRRFMPYMRDLRRRVEDKEFGPLESIVHHEGYKLSWPFESGAAFHKTAERTGVIMDFGVHVIDFYEYLFHPSWKLVSAIHDGFMGPEGLAEILLEANGVPLSMRLSRYQKQSNVALLFFQKAKVAINLDALNTYTIQDISGSTHHVTASSPVDSYNALADEVLDNFVAAAAGQASLICPASSSLPVIEILDEIYLSAQKYPETIGAV